MRIESTITAIAAGIALGWLLLAPCVISNTIGDWLQKIGVENVWNLTPFFLTSGCLLSIAWMASRERDHKW